MWGNVYESSLAVILKRLDRLAEMYELARNTETNMESWKIDDQKDVIRDLEVKRTVFVQAELSAESPCKLCILIIQTKHLSGRLR